MKIKASTGRKLRYGGTSLALTALIIAAVIIVNVIFSLFVQRFTLYVDLTPELKFTISDECYDIIGKTDAGDGVDSPVEMVEKFRAENKAYNEANGLKEGDKGYKDENVKINILFLMDKDLLQNDETTNYVVVNAEEIRSKYPDYVTTEYVDASLHPSRFKKYLSTNTESIETESVIVECGSEFRIKTLRSFFIFQDAETPIAYNGEKAFASSILAVTRAESPVACYTTGHGEDFPVAEDGTVPFITSLEDAGYEVRAIDLSRDEIPEECRLMVIFDPKNDFLSEKDGTTEVDELTKLDYFLDDKNSLMVFMDPEKVGAPLPNLEEFLEEWGLAFRRDSVSDSPYMISENSGNTILGDRTAIVGTYASNELANGFMSGMLNRTTAPKVVFPGAAALTQPSGYERKLIDETDDEGKKTGNSFYISTNGRRTVYDLFTSSSSAVANVNGVEMAAATASNPFPIMSVSVDSTFVQEGNTSQGYYDSAYVILCGTTEFASEKYLKSNTYGNADLMLSTCERIGREPVAVGLKYKEFANYTIETITSEAATAYTAIFTVAPLFIALCVGVVVLVRRKNR